MEDSGGEEETRFCKNCQRDVSAANFVVHEVHCARNITCCPQCKEPVPRSSLDEHIDENHKLVTCKQCREEMECCLLEEHMESECSMRDVECQYCELQIKAHEKLEHEDRCGSRTDVCEKCQQYVMLKMMKEHEEYYCGKPTNLRDPPAEREEGGAYGGADVEAVGLDQSWMDAINACREEGQSVDSIVAQNLAQENHMYKPVVNDTSNEQVAQRLQEEVPYYDTSSSSAVEEQKRQFEQLRQLQEDAEMAMKLQEQLDAENEFHNAPHMMPHEDHMMLDQLPPHVGQMIPDRDHMMPHGDLMHMTTDEDNAMAGEDHVMPNNLNSHVMPNDNDEDHMRPRMGAAMAHMMPHQNQMRDLPNDFADLRINRPNRMPDEELLPCEFCGKGIPPEYLQVHQLQQCPQLQGGNQPFPPSHVTGIPTPAPTAKADEVLLPCEFCGKGIPPEYLQTHQLQRCPRLPNNDAFQSPHVADTPPLVPADVTNHITPTAKAPDVVLLPCEFCGKGISPQDLETHQVQECPRLPDNNAFQPTHVADMSPPVSSDVTDHKDITPATTGSYSLIHCDYCNARIPSGQYNKHLELCDNANNTVPCEHCDHPMPLYRLYEHQAICTQNVTLYGRTSAMRFPNNPWPGKEKDSGIHKASPWLHSKNIPPIRQDPVTISTETSLSSSDNSFHSNTDEPPFYHDTEDTVSNGLSSNKRAGVTKHDQFSQRHTYTPAGAGSVSVNGTGIKATSYPPPQY